MLNSILEFNCLSVIQLKANAGTQHHTLHSLKAVFFYNPILTLNFIFLEGCLYFIGFFVSLVWLDFGVRSQQSKCVNIGYLLSE